MSEKKPSPLEYLLMQGGNPDDILPEIERCGVPVALGGLVAEAIREAMRELYNEGHADGYKLGFRDADTVIKDPYPGDK